MGYEIPPKPKKRLSRKKRHTPSFANQEDRHGKLAPQLLTDIEEAFETRRRPARLVRKAKKPTDPQTLPNYSIGRPINRHTPEAAEWRAFLADAVECNEGRGRVVSLGGVACEYVSDDSIKAMLGSKYSRVFSERDRAVRILRDFASDFNHFAQEQTKSRQDAAFETANGPLQPAERMLSSGDDLYLLPVSPASQVANGVYQHETIDDYDDDWHFDLGFDDFDDTPPCYDRVNEGIVDWGHGVFKTDTIVSCGRLGMAVSLDRRDELDHEFQDVKTYLRREAKLDPRLMVSPFDGYTFSFEQRAHVFTGQDGAGTMLHSMDIPTSLPLYPPAARDITRLQI